MSVHGVSSSQETTKPLGQKSVVGQGKAFMWSSHHARPPARRTLGVCWLYCLHLVHPTSFSAFSDCPLETLVVHHPLQIAWSCPPLGDSVPSWWLWSVLASLGQQWELDPVSCTVQNTCPPPASWAAGRGSLLAPLCWERLHRLVVWLVWAFPFSWQARADGHWCHAELGVFSCCPEGLHSCLRQQQCLHSMLWISTYTVCIGIMLQHPLSPTHSTSTGVHRITG